MPSASSESILSEKWAAFIQSGVAMIVASRDPQNNPVLMRGLGCRVAPNRQKVSILASASQSQPLIDAIRATGSVAAVFTQPSTHASMQLKGDQASVETSRPADLSLLNRYTKAFLADIIPLGYAEEFIRAMLWTDPADLVVVTFTPAAAFLQTPGPRAGEPLRP